MSDSVPAAPHHRGERRWPMALAVLVTAALQFVFPASFRSIPPLVHVVVLLVLARAINTLPG